MTFRQGDELLTIDELRDAIHYVRHCHMRRFPELRGARVTVFASYDCWAAIAQSKSRYDYTPWLSLPMMESEDGKPTATLDGFPIYIMRRTSDNLGGEGVRIYIDLMQE